jgi:hypothetical protein
MMSRNYFQYFERVALAVGSRFGRHLQRISSDILAIPLWTGAVAFHSSLSITVEPFPEGRVLRRWLNICSNNLRIGVMVEVFGRGD